MGVITITGSLGSGKSTVGNLLAKKLGYEYINGSKIFRELSDKLGISIVEMNNMAEEIDLDNKTDNYLKGLNSKNNIIVDSRLAWFFIEKSFKVYLYVDLHTAVERISESDRTTEGDLLNKKELEENLKLRRNLEVYRFKKLYNIDIDNKENYDLVINTAKLTPEQIVETIIVSGGLEI